MVKTTTRIDTSGRMGRRFAYERVAGLRGLRAQTDMAHEMRARGCGTTQTAWSNWERGIHEPRPNVVPLIADALGCAPDDLYTGDDEDEVSADLASTLHRLAMDARWLAHEVSRVAREVARA